MTGMEEGGASMGGPCGCTPDPLAAEGGCEKKIITSQHDILAAYMLIRTFIYY